MRTHLNAFKTLTAVRGEEDKTITVGSIVTVCVSLNRLTSASQTLVTDSYEHGNDVIDDVAQEEEEEEEEEDAKSPSVCVFVVQRC